MQQVLLQTTTGFTRLEKLESTANSMNKITDILREFYHHVASAKGDELYLSVLKKLAILASADYVFICKFCNEEKTRVRTIAVYGDGKLRKNFEFDLNDTPCQQVVKHGTCCFIHGVQSQFPLDQLSIELGVNSCIGRSLKDSNGQVMGPIAILGREPLRNNVLVESLLQVYALRVEADLE